MAPTIQETIKIAEHLIQNTIPALLIKPGIKKPIPSPANESWWIINDPDNAELVIKQTALKGGCPNLAVCLGWQKESPIIAVGVDLYKPTGQEAASLVKSLGVSTKESVWVMQTGRKGLTVFYHYDGPDLERQAAVNNPALDLMSNGYTLVPPSSTDKLPVQKGEPPGGPYTWIKDHSPFDIPFTELMPAPVLLLEYWNNLADKNQSRKAENTNIPPSGKNPILEEALGPGFHNGQQDNKLTALAAHVNGLGIPRFEAEAIMLAAARNCKPPWASGDREVLKKLDSAERKFGKSNKPTMVNEVLT